MIKDTSWVSAIFCMLGGAIMIFFWRKTSKIIGSDWWPFYRFMGKEYTEDEKRHIKVYRRIVSACMLDLFILAVIIGLIFFRPRR